MILFIVFVVVVIATVRMIVKRFGPLSDERLGKMVIAEYKKFKNSSAGLVIKDQRKRHNLEGVICDSHPRVQMLNRYVRHIIACSSLEPKITLVYSSIGASKNTSEFFAKLGHEPDMELASTRHYCEFDDFSIMLKSTCNENFHMCISVWKGDGTSLDGLITVILSSELPRNVRKANDEVAMVLAARLNGTLAAAGKGGKVTDQFEEVIKKVS